MLHIAAIGSLAEQVENFTTVDLHTDVQWYKLTSIKPSSDIKLTKLDLILFLHEDIAAKNIVEELSSEIPVLALIGSALEQIPTTSSLDLTLQKSLSDVYGFVVGYSQAMHKACRWIRAIAHQTSAALDLRTLILGETGTGKALAAKAIHRLSMRSNKPFITFNCGGVSKDLLNSDLFGHIKGAFTNAILDRAGALKSAADGMLFLDEIGDLPAPTQTTLLHVLEERRYMPVGSDREYPFRAQVISATNRRLDEMVKQGEFRADLYFRIAQANIFLPALTERHRDIPILMGVFLDEYGLSLDVISSRLAAEMLEYSWPGNIRELRSAIERFVLLFHSGDEINSLKDLLNELNLEDKEDANKQLTKRTQDIEPISEEPTKRTLAALRDNLDRAVLKEVLAKHNGNVALVAEELDITRRSVYNLVRRHGLKIEKRKIKRNLV